MEAKSDKNTPKRFSFRKRRSSKGKKDNDSPPVDFETEQEASELVQNCESMPEKASDTAVEPEQTAPITAEEEKAAQSCGEDASPKTGDSHPNEGAKKKKSKRRSLFKRKKSSEKVDDGCELKTKENGASEPEDEASEATFVESAATDVNSRINQEQVVCEEQERQGEITDQSDGEQGYLSVGEASEAEGETLIEGKESTPASLIDVEEDKGTKRKSFFKRGLSLKRRKSKKQTNESKEAATEQPCDVEVQTEPQNTAEIDEINKTEPDNETNEDLEDINNETTAEEQITLSAIAKKYPTKPPRKVSFVGPDGTKLESSDEGDSPTEQVVETGDESDEDTITAEDDPSEVSNEVSEIVAPEVVVMSEDAGCSEPFAEGDDDDLTEVSSMSSSLLASSDAPDTISTSDASRLCTLTDTDDSGSRITLEGISEESEAESKPEVLSESDSESKQEVANEEAGTDSKPDVSGEVTGFESRPEVCEKKREDEATKLLGDGDGSKIGEWELVNKANDMSVELHRVRKQTLFNVKRLCCSVM